MFIHSTNICPFHFRYEFHISPETSLIPNSQFSLIIKKEEDPLNNYH